MVQGLRPWLWERMALWAGRQDVVVIIPPAPWAGSVEPIRCRVEQSQTELWTVVMPGFAIATGFRPNGLDSSHSQGQRPWSTTHHDPQAPTGRPFAASSPVMPDADLQSHTYRSSIAISCLWHSSRYSSWNERCWWCASCWSAYSITPGRFDWLTEKTPYPVCHANVGTPRGCSLAHFEVSVLMCSTSAAIVTVRDSPHTTCTWSIHPPQRFGKHPACST